MLVPSTLAVIDGDLVSVADFGISVFSVGVSWCGGAVVGVAVGVVVAAWISGGGFPFEELSELLSEASLLLDK